MCVFCVPHESWATRHGLGFNVRLMDFVGKEGRN